MPAVVTKNPNVVPAGMVEVKPAAAPPKPVEAKPEPVAPAAEAKPEVAQVAEAATVEIPTESESASKRAKDAADRARKGAAANKKLLEEKSRIEQAAQYQAQQTHALEQRLQQADQLLRNFAQDPVAVMKQLGVTPEEVAKRMAMDGSPEGKIAQLEQALQAQRAELEKLQNQSRAEQEGLRRQQVENEYKQQAQDVKRYPNLAGVHPDFVLARTQQLIVELQRKGHDPKRFTNHDLLEYLDSTYTKNTAETSAPETEPKPEKKTATITNKLQSAKHVAPPDPTKMNDRQWKKWAAEELARSMTK